MTKITLPPLPPIPREVVISHDPEMGAVYGQDSDELIYWAVSYATKAAQDARHAAIEDVACMICRRFDLNIPADLGPKLLEAIRSMSTIPEKDHGEPS